MNSRVDVAVMIGSGVPATLRALGKPICWVVLVNGERRQRSNTRNLILGVPQLIELASSFYTLEPGDVIFTGTPDGVGPVVAGDTIRASIAGIGSMEVRVRGH